MHESLEDNLTRVHADTTKSEKVRQLAGELLEIHKQGIVPSSKQLEKLSMMQMPAPECARLDRDGGCAWLRKYGKGHGLPVPPIGEIAMCPFRVGNFQKCPGYRRS